MKNGIYRDPEGVIRVDAGHPELGMYRIEVSKVIEYNRAMDMCHGLNQMPSNNDVGMFSVFLTDEMATEGTGSRKVPGYIIKRKVLLNDKVQFLDKLNVVKTVKR